MARRYCSRWPRPCAGALPTSSAVCSPATRLRSPWPLLQPDRRRHRAGAGPARARRSAGAGRPALGDRRRHLQRHRPAALLPRPLGRGDVDRGADRRVRHADPGASRSPAATRPRRSRWPGSSPRWSASCSSRARPAAPAIPPAALVRARTLRSARRSASASSTFACTPVRPPRVSRSGSSAAPASARSRSLLGDRAARPATARLAGNQDRADRRASALLDTLANALFAIAALGGNLGVVSVLGSLYPVATVVLARVLLAERLGRPQAAGVVLALAGVSMMSLG